MGTLLYQWAARGCDKERCMKIARNSDIILPQLMPQFFQKSERVEGDGGVGTVRLMTLGPGKKHPQSSLGWVLGNWFLHT